MFRFLWTRTITLIHSLIFAFHRLLDYPCFCMYTLVRIVRERKIDINFSLHTLLHPSLYRIFLHSPLSALSALPHCRTSSISTSPPQPRRCISIRLTENASHRNPHPHLSPYSRSLIAIPSHLPSTLFFCFHFLRRAVNESLMYVTAAAAHHHSPPALFAAHVTFMLVYARPHVYLFEHAAGEDCLTQRQRATTKLNAVSSASTSARAMPQYHIS